ncbi:putative Candidate membrane protein [Burkholderiales bacterium]|nr:putative Candidate membrane protein [Burkholderiales bacterium]
MQEESWLWIGKYVIVIIAALALGAVLGSLEPFRETTIGSARIGAGALVQVIAHSGALALLWALGYRHAAQLRRGAGSSAHLATSVLALVSLVVAASFYAVLARFLSPLLAQDVKAYLDWTFIVIILATAGWLLWSLFVHSEAVIAAISKAGRDRGSVGGP